ncbi:MAG: DUF4011 domain-containing protein [Bacteroidales bacterium]
MTIDIEHKIEKWKNKLLDLGKRNRLLNYKDTKRSNLKILTPCCLSLWQSFVQDETPLEFPFYDESSEEDSEELSEELTEEITEESSYSITTNQTIKEMQKTLRNLRDKAKTANEEQGINTLYLSFGFLKWTEKINSDNYLNSPIILVPVTLTIESIISPYILSLHEDETVINPTLCHKLENDFGIKFPDLNEDVDIKDYLENIKKIVSNNKWEVEFDVTLSLLSFSKINMYNDLLRNKEKIKQNSIIRRISGDASACADIPEEIEDLDKHLKPTQVFQVVDADSSQQEAILLAKKGTSFILQGPPGTGKSQTITNIISECLAEEKKVLFVSEKMAALAVVHNRLTEAELDDFCLILHSDKANKKSVLEQLGKVIKMAEKKVQLKNEVYQKLDALQSNKEKLNDYASQIAEKISPLDKSIFEANGILAYLDSYDDIIFSIENIEKITKKQYDKYLNLLRQLVNTIGKMSEDYSNNPWHGTTIRAITNELRHDMGANFTTLIPNVSDLKQKTQQIFEELTLQWKTSYSALKQLTPILDIAKQSHVVPISWIYENEISPLFDEIAQHKNLKSDFLQKRSELATQYSNISAKDNSINNLDAKTLITTSEIRNSIEHIKSITSKLPYSKWSLADTRLFSIFEEAKEHSEKLNKLNNEISQQFEKEVFAIDFQGIYNRYKTDYTSFFKYFNKEYREDKKTIRRCCKTIVKKFTDSMVLDIVMKLRSHSEHTKWFSDKNTELTNYFEDLYCVEKTDFNLIERHFSAFKSLDKAHLLLIEMQKITEIIDKEESNLTAHYQFLYKGLHTEWEDIKQALTWAESFKQQVQANNLNRSFVELVCSKLETRELCKTYSSEVQSMLSDIDIKFQWFISLFDSKEKIESLEMPVLQDKLEQCKNNLFLLEEWIDFCNARKECLIKGLTNYITKIDELKIRKDSIIPSFKKRFFRLWLDAVLPQYPAVINFRRQTHENTIKDFAELDKLQFVISKEIIKSKLINNLPSMNHVTSGFDEIGILKREMSKQRKIMPVRKLFKEIPNLLLTLKPCLMMSPLSVSLFLEADTYMFDTIIFDEASQVCTENAIGSIFRGKQVIIAGDNKQLPPTNFFKASTSEIEFDDKDDDDYENDDENAYESILDEANLLPEKTLRWHYRSRHEHLIAFSNAKIYHNKLITFPSNQENTKDNGVEYIYVNNGVFDKGNAIEAKKVAELIFKHFRDQPGRSLGVITFGDAQQDAILKEVRSMRFQDQQYEHFFNEERDEPFFIKNLENVQGDERDTIIFSIGYAKNSAGVFKMNFGPLNKLGGERRLNVAITRAKFNVKLVGSIMPTDIDLNRLSSEGPKLLRSYIDFAQNGINSLIRTVTESDIISHDSPFEEAVYNFLDRKGYKISTQVGCSGYRIDMAAKHPTLNGIFVLGIECDGATYHSARTARERDRLRQDVLENMGWKIYRIWSTDWNKDPITEGKKLIEAITNEISNYDSSKNAQREKFEKPISDSFITESKDVVDLEQQSNPYQFEKTIDFKLPCNSDENVDLSDYITEIVKMQFPLHYDLLSQKIAPLYGNQKATIKIRREVDAALEKLGTSIYREKDFLYPSKDAKIIVKMPNDRTINYIAIKEIAEAMMKILGHCIGGTNRERLLSETRKVYGFKNTGQNIATALNEAYNLLINTGRIKIVDEKLVICNK